MPHRREMLSHSAGLAALLAGAGLMPPAAQAAWTQAAFEARSVPDAIKALGGAAPQASAAVTLTAVDIAENGAAVPMAIATTLPNVRRLLLLVEKNPTALAAVFDLTDAVEPALSTRAKMSESSNVYAVALTGDGKVYFAQKEVKVTLGGCGG